MTDTNATPAGDGVPAESPDGPTAPDPVATDPVATQAPPAVPAAPDPAAVPPEPGPRPSPAAVGASGVSPAAVADPAPGGTAGRRRRAGGPIQAVGRRKEAVVRVRIGPGTGTIVCNGQPLETYFPSKVHQQLVKSPLVLTERVESVDVRANLRGGGTSGQAGALRLAIARALCELDADHRPALKKAGFLTRDARVIERKKYGLKKARKAPQYSKR